MCQTTPHNCVIFQFEIVEWWSWEIRDSIHFFEILPPCFQCSGERSTFPQASAERRPLHRSVASMIPPATQSARRIHDRTGSFRNLKMALMVQSSSLKELLGTAASWAERPTINQRSEFQENVFESDYQEERKWQGDASRVAAAAQLPAWKRFSDELLPLGQRWIVDSMSNTMWWVERDSFQGLLALLFSFPPPSYFCTRPHPASFIFLFLCWPALLIWLCFFLAIY